MKIKRIHHVAIAVNDMRPPEVFLTDILEIGPAHHEHRAASNLEIAMFPVVDCKIELLKANGPGSQVEDFVRARGEGLFHVCFEVDDIDAAMKELGGKGIRFRNEFAQPGHAGTRIAFVDPATTGGVLFELLEAPRIARLCPVACVAANLDRPLDFNSC